MTRSRAALPAVLLALLLLVAACGGGGGETAEPAAEDSPATDTEAPEEPAEPTESADDGTVTRADADLVIWADGTRTPVLRPFAEDFAEREGITVEVQEVANEQLRTQFVTQAPNGTGPDIVVGAHDWLGELVTNGVVEPVDLGDRAGDFSEVAVQAFTYDGQVYGVPYAVENIALIRNTDLVPEAPATWEEVRDTALRLESEGAVTEGLVMPTSPADPYHNYPLFSAHGGYVFGMAEDGSYDPTDLGIDSPGGLEAATAFRQWVEEGLIPTDVSSDVAREVFTAGDAAFIITGPWNVTRDDGAGIGQVGMPYEITPIPPVDGGTARPFVGVQGFMVSSFSQNTLAAQTFLLDFMATEEAQLALYEAGGRAPALTAALEQVGDDPDVAAFGEAGAEGQPLPAIPEMGSVWEAWTNAYNLIYTGEGDAQDHFRTAAEQIRTLIEQ